MQAIYMICYHINITVNRECAATTRFCGIKFLMELVSVDPSNNDPRAVQQAIHIYLKQKNHDDFCIYYLIYLFLAPCVKSDNCTKIKNSPAGPGQIG